MFFLWLHLLSWCYGLVVRLRNVLYNKKIKKSRYYNKPLVIGIGNLSAGGTGKTPLVIYLAQWLAKQKVVAVLSRGYKRKSVGFKFIQTDTSVEEAGDEPYIIYQKFVHNHNVVVAVCEDRAVGIAQIATHRPDVDLVLLDDAFQHRSVIPHVNILLTPFHQPFFTDHLLPLGRLREPKEGATRADILIVTKSPSNLTTIAMNGLKTALQAYHSGPIFFTSIVYRKPVDSWSNQQGNLPATLVLVTAIADPLPLRLYLEASGHEVVHLVFADHHWFHYRDIVHIVHTFHRLQATDKAIVTTEKDYVRLIHPHWTSLLRSLAIFYIPIEIAFVPSSDQYNYAAYIAHRCL